MPQDRAAATRQKLIQAATELIRRKGFVATRVEDICELSGVTKGAFFHHFQTKEELAGACLAEWTRGLASSLGAARFQSAGSPRERLMGCMEFMIGMLEDPHTIKSCLVGTTVQEVCETHPQLREAAHQCLAAAKSRFQGLLDDACQGTADPVDTASLADLWVGSIQGALILCKASGDVSVIRRNLEHVSKYIMESVPGATKAAARRAGVRSRT